MKFEELTEQELLSLVIYGEARGEPPIGKLAVAHVIMNRAANPGWWGRSIKEVILKPKQFSCFNSNDPNREQLIKMASSGVYEQGCISVALLALGGHTIDPTGGATHYHAVGCQPTWIEEMILLKRVNRHVFYRER